MEPQISVRNGLPQCSISHIRAFISSPGLCPHQPTDGSFSFSIFIILALVRNQATNCVGQDAKTRWQSSHLPAYARTSRLMGLTSVIVHYNLANVFEGAWSPPISVAATGTPFLLPVAAGRVVCNILYLRLLRLHIILTLGVAQSEPRSVQSCLSSSNQVSQSSAVFEVQDMKQLQGYIDRVA